MMQRAINAKAKASLRSNIMVRDSNICYSRGYCSSNNTTSKVQTQSITAKNSNPQELKVKKVKPKDPNKLFEQT